MKCVCVCACAYGGSSGSDTHIQIQYKYNTMRMTIRAYNIQHVFLCCIYTSIGSQVHSPRPLRMQRQVEGVLTANKVLVVASLVQHFLSSRVVQ